MRFITLNKESFFILIFGLSVCYLALNLQGCSYPMPKVDVTFWAGDPSIDGVSRAQDNEHMVCSDQKFEDYACLTYADIKKLYAAMLQCKEWGPPIATKDEVTALLKKNSEVVHHVVSAKAQ